MEAVLEKAQLPLMLQSFLNTIEKRKDHIACGHILEDSIDFYTYDQLGKQVEQFAGHLQTFCNKGDRAIILAETHNEFVIAFYGCLLAGVVAVPCHVGSPKKADKLQHIITDCGAKVVIGLQETLNKFTDVLAPHAQLISVSNTPVDALYTEVQVDETDIAFLQYTSGTTSDPKGVMINYANLLANLQMIKQSFLFNQDLIMVSWLPFYHDMGLIGMILSPLFSGGTVYYLSPLDFMKRPIKWVKSLADLQATCTGAPNFAFDHCVQRIKDEDCSEIDLSKLQTIFCGAEPIRVESLEEFHKKFEPFGFNYNALYPCYGMAEVVLFATGGEMKEPLYSKSFHDEDLKLNKVTPLEDGHPEAVRLVGCGFPAIGLGGKVLIVDPETREPTPKGIGEIWISGPHVSKGYWNKPEVSLTSLQAKLKEDDGHTYLRTGDLGFMYQDDLFISGRIKDLIIIAGRNIHPHDVAASVNESHELLEPGRCTAFPIMEDNREVLVTVKELHRGIYRTLQQLLQNPDNQEAKEQAKEIYRSIQKQVSEDNGVLTHDIFFIPQGRLAVTTSGKVKVQATKKLYEANNLDGFSLTKLIKSL